MSGTQLFLANKLCECIYLMLYQVGRAATCSEGFVKCFLRVPRLLGCTAADMLKHGKRSENMLRNLRNKWPPHLVVSLRAFSKYYSYYPFQSMVWYALIHCRIRKKSKMKLRGGKFKSLKKPPATSVQNSIGNMQLWAHNNGYCDKAQKSTHDATAMLDSIENYWRGSNVVETTTITYTVWWIQLYFRNWSIWAKGYSRMSQFWNTAHPVL